LFDSDQCIPSNITPGFKQVQAWKKMNQILFCFTHFDIKNNKKKFTFYIKSQTWIIIMGIPKVNYVNTILGI